MAFSMLPRLQHLTYDPLIWLKVTSMASTALVLKDVRISLEIPSFYSNSSGFHLSIENDYTFRFKS